MPVKLDEIKLKLGALAKKARVLTELFVGPQDVLAVDVGTYAVKLAHLKQESGSFSIVLRVVTTETSLDLVSTSGAAAMTVTVSAVVARRTG